MERFADALVSKYTLKIPKEDDWFAPFIGDWDVSCYSKAKNNRWQTRGEWLFRRILDGTAVEDLFLCPDRKPECSAAIRLYSAQERCYMVTCTQGSTMLRLRFVKKDGKLVGTNLEKPGEMHVFSDIQENSFTWNRVAVLENGSWQENCTIYATRKRS